MTEYNLALFFHLLGAFSLIAGTIVAGVAFEAARRRRHPAEIALLLGLTRIGLARADHPLVRPHGSPSPLPLIYHLGVGLLDESTGAGRASHPASRPAP